MDAILLDIFRSAEQIRDFIAVFQIIFPVINAGNLIEHRRKRLFDIGFCFFGGICFADQCSNSFLQCIIILIHIDTSTAVKAGKSDRHIIFDLHILNLHKGFYFDGLIAVFQLHFVIIQKLRIHVAADLDLIPIGKFTDR